MAKNNIISYITEMGVVTLDRTPRNIFHMATVELGDILRENIVLEEIELTKQRYIEIAQHFQEALLLGRTDAALFLAFLSFNGFGLRQNTTDAALWIAIGSAIGNPLCELVAKGQNPGAALDIIDMSEFLRAKPEFDKTITTQAASYAKAIKKFNDRCEINNNTIVDNLIVNDAIKAFESAGRFHSLHIIHDDSSEIHIPLIREPSFNENLLKQQKSSESLLSSATETNSFDHNVHGTSDPNTVQVGGQVEAQHHCCYF